MAFTMAKNPRPFEIVMTCTKSLICPHSAIICTERNDVSKKTFFGRLNGIGRDVNKGRRKRGCNTTFEQDELTI